MIGGRGQVYQLTGRYAGGAGRFRPRDRAGPGQSRGDRQPRHHLRAHGPVPEALADFGRAIELNPNLAGAFGSRGIIFRLMGRYADALADFSRAIELNPHDAGAIRSRGQTYRLMGQAWEALADFNRAIELNPDDAVAIGSRGQIHQAEGRYQDALADFDRAIELNPNLAGAISGRGVIFRLMGRFEEALADFNRAIELSPDEGRALGNRSEPTGARGRPEPPRGRGNGAGSRHDSVVAAGSSRSRGCPPGDRYRAFRPAAAWGLEPTVAVSRPGQLCAPMACEPSGPRDPAVGGSDGLIGEDVA